MELLELLQKRRSIRKYTGEHIPEDKLEKILQAGLPAPSSRAYSERTEKHSRSFSVSCCASDFCLRFSRTACVGGLSALMPKPAARSLRCLPAVYTIFDGFKYIQYTFLQN